ncbi:MAG: AMIN domain-containing protein, partial [Terriglobia bacterium]
MDRSGISSSTDASGFPGNDIRRPLRARRQSRVTAPMTSGVLLALVALACLVAPAAQAQRAARSAAEKRRLAEAHYHQALEVRKAFDEMPFEDRVARDYQKVIQAFRRVYWTTPAYANNTLSLLAVGELYEEMGRRWENRKAFESSIEAYEFLAREYPRSQFRATARLAIARIYREGLQRPEEALKRFEQFATDFPRHSQAETVRAAISELRETVAAGTKKAEEPQAAASSEPAAPPAATPGNLALVSGVRHWVTPDYTRVVIDVERDIKYEVGRVGNPPRVYIDLFDSRPAADVSSKTVPVENTLLTGVRTRRHKADVTRVVLY